MRLINDANISPAKGRTNLKGNNGNDDYPRSLALGSIMSRGIEISKATLKNGELTRLINEFGRQRWPDLSDDSI